MAAALAESKRFQEAATAARAAAKAAEAAGRTDLAARIEVLAARYARGQTYEYPPAKKSLK